MVNVQSAVNRTLHNPITSRFVPKVRAEAASTPKPMAGAPTLTNDPGADFRALFTSRSNPPTVSIPVTEPPKPSVPTLESVFGTSNAFVSNPGGVAPNGVTYNYNPEYFATRETADKLAEMYGGKVVEMNAITPYGPFQQNQKNEMIQFSNGNVVNAGILASYYNRGYTQDYIDKSIAKEIHDIPG
jgi:hypothetical protein